MKLGVAGTRQEVGALYFALQMLLADTETKDPPGRPVCQIHEEGAWWTVPFEWNTCIALVERGVAAARVLDASGVVVRLHPDPEAAVDTPRVMAPYPKVPPEEWA